MTTKKKITKKRIIKKNITEYALLDAGFRKSYVKEVPPSELDVYWFELELGIDGDILLITNAADEDQNNPKFYVEIFEKGGLGRCFNEDELWDLLKCLTKHMDSPI